jgi:hypothetical protein
VVSELLQGYLGTWRSKTQLLFGAAARLPHCTVAFLRRRRWAIFVPVSKQILAQLAFGPGYGAIS